MNKPQTANAVSNAKAKPVRGLFIDGKEVPAGTRETFPVISPGTGEIIAHSVNASEADVDAAIASAREFGQEAFDHYFYTKAVMVNKSNEPFDWFEPEMRDLRLN